MLIKDLAVPLWLIQTEALKKRISPGHYRLLEIEQDLAKIKAGYKGELILSYYVKQLPHDKYYSECRNFLHIPTIDTAQKLLFLLNLPTSGHKRGRLYYPHSKEFPVHLEKTSLKQDRKVPHAFLNKK